MRQRLSFRFMGYELRPTEPKDIDLARAWTTADPHHAGLIAPEFWIEQGRGVGGMELTYVLCSPDGNLLFLRMERVARLYIQFSPIESAEDSKRLRTALKAGMEYLEIALGAVGIGELIFDTASSLLRAFACRTLGFSTEGPAVLRRRLSVYSPRTEDGPIAPPEGNGAGEGDPGPVEAQPIKLQGVM